VCKTALPVPINILKCRSVFCYFMIRDALIDEELSDWLVIDNRGRLAGYGKTFTTGKNGDLPWLDSDGKVATFCKENNCDLFTSDKKPYTNYFDAKIQSIQISRYSYWRDGKRPILLIRVIG